MTKAEARRPNLKESHPNPDILDSNDVVSSTECTGMVQAVTEDKNSMENYQDIYDIPDQGTLKQVEEEIEKQLKNDK